MFEFFKDLANDNNWHFTYARHDHQNLAELSGTTIGLFVDPIETHSQFTSIGNESKSYSGFFLLLINSDIDDSYSDKYDEIVERLSNPIQLIKDALACSNFEIESFRTIEVINYFDNNYDGWMVNYKVTAVE